MYTAAIIAHTCPELFRANSTSPSSRPEKAMAPMVAQCRTIQALATTSDCQEFLKGIEEGLKFIAPRFMASLPK